MKIEGTDWILIIWLMILFLVSAGFIGSEIGKANIGLSQETADKICFELTGQEGVAAKDWGDFVTGKQPIEKGELYCQIPSYDSTQLIKVGE